MNLRQLRSFRPIILPAILLSIGLGLASVGQAVQVRDGTVYFNSPPRLLGVASTAKGTWTWGAYYYFRLNLPDNAGEPLARVDISQQPGLDTVEFNLQETEAFEGETDRAAATRLPLGTVTRDRATQTIAITFDPPIPPGKTITISLRPQRNPHIAGVYLFGVTAFPQGEKSHGQFLGYGRFHFYNSSPLWFWR